MTKLIQLLLLFNLVVTHAYAQSAKSTSETIKISKEVLKDKIMGGWAGQTIGVTFGGPTEFRFCGTMIQDYQPISWYDGYIKKTMVENPGLYDDIYMDLTFVDIIEKKGLDAPVSEFANAYANAEYMLWHANQAGRYNILHGLSAPQSGHWLNNPHADCIDYQIEADFAGLMSPGMPNAASAISDKIGHIMNYGDGWYGGVYMGAMYSLAFTTNDINKIVEEGLRSVPESTHFHNVIKDVIAWHKKYPNDWKRTWFEIEAKYSEDRGCPEGIFVPFNIDASVNAAYVVLGLLYGNGDYTKTLEISTRAGQDSDCNPSSAGGILGTVIGYNNIPAHWKQGLKEAESLDFKYTSMSLDEVYAIGYKHAMANITRNGGKVLQNDVQIMVQKIVPVKVEQSFVGHYPIEKQAVFKDLKDEFTFEFDGVGFVIRGNAGKWNSNSKHVFKAQLTIDGQVVEEASLPASFTARRHELFWKYELPNKKHTVKIKLMNAAADENVRIEDIVIYGNAPRKKSY
ncbi:MAG: ADP-ribosylglycohydrolase family protein [Chryseolinea sp.]